MTYRIIGAILVIISCSGVGFSIANVHKREVDGLKQLLRALDFMACELEFRMPDLPQLCHLTAMQVSGSLRSLFRQLESEFNQQVSADALCCMRAAISKTDKLTEITKQNLLLLGKTLGRFDLQGQLSGISSVVQLCQRDLDGLLNNQDVRLRSYRTLGICAGVALVILFI